MGVGLGRGVGVGLELVPVFNVAYKLHWLDVVVTPAVGNVGGIIENG